MNSLYSWSVLEKQNGGIREAIRLATAAIRYAGANALQNMTL